MTESLASVLNANSFLSLTSSNRILCSYTKHEMPARLDCVLNHLNSKVLKKAQEWYSYDYSEFLPYIVPDKRDNKKVHCKLTQRTLNKIPNEIKKHIQGKKFLRLKKEYEDRKNKKNKSTNDDDEDDEEVDFWVPPDDDDDEDEGAGHSINPTKRAKKSHDEENDMDEDMDEDEITEQNNSNNNKHAKYDEIMDYKIDKDDEDDDLKFYIRKDKQKNKKGRKRR